MEHWKPDPDMKANVNVVPDEIADEAACSTVIEQLSYLLEELAAQKPLFSKISETIVSERPVRDQNSIKDHYLTMRFREERVNTVIIEGLIRGDLCGKSVDDTLSEGNPERSGSESLADIQERISESRQSIIDMLRDAPSKAWNSSVIENGRRRTLLEWAFKMALEDADTLREISMQLSEIQLIFRR